MQESPRESQEDRAKRLDREVAELLNELRVVLPGIQVLFAFMLIVPFSQGFVKVTDAGRWVYFGAFLSAALGAALLIAPFSYHRLRFRHHDKERLLRASNRMAIGGMAFVCVSMTCVVGLITDVVFDARVGVIAALAVGGWFAWFWYGLPLSRHPGGGSGPSGGS